MLGVARTAEPKVLKERQRLLLEVVENRPGIPMADLETLLGYGWGSLYTHLRALEKLGLVEVRARGKFRLVFPAGARREEVDAAVPRRLGKPARAVAQLIVKDPGRGIEEYAAKLPIGRRASYYHVERFVRMGLVTTAQEGRYVELRPTTKLYELLGIPATG